MKYSIRHIPSVLSNVPAIAMATIVVLTLSFPAPSLADGNVSVQLLADGTLEVLGDRKGNGVSITPAVGGKIAVVGFLLEGAPTTINGDTAFTVVVGDVTRIIVTTGGNRDFARGASF